MMMNTAYVAVRLGLSGILLAGTLAVLPDAEAKPPHAKGQVHQKQGYAHQKSASWQESDRFLTKNDKHDDDWHDRHHGRDWDDDRNDQRDHRHGNGWDSRNWNDHDRDRFRDWLGQVRDRRYPYRGNISRDVLRRYGLSRAEFESLPPGIQKNILRGKPLPPGHAKKLGPGYRLSRDQMGQISPIGDAIRSALGLPTSYYNYNDGRRVGRYGNSAILYNPNTGIISSVLSGIFN